MPKALPPEHQQRLDESSKRLFARGKKTAKNGTTAKEETLRAVEAQAEGQEAKPASVLTQPAKPQPAVIQARTLIHEDGRQYSFRLLPNGDVSVQQQRKGDLVAVYVMPRPEGDYLWRRLRGQGFERF